jgi:SAM-dependent methyltransferase
LTGLGRFGLSAGVDPPADERSLDARCQASLQAALVGRGTRAPPPWMRPRLPPAIGATMLQVALLEGGLPAALAAHHLDAAPRALVEQRLRGDDDARRLLFRPIEAARVPGLSAAVDRACALWLQSRACPRHVFPGRSGEAMPGISLFVLLHLFGPEDAAALVAKAARALAPGGRVVIADLLLDDDHRGPPTGLLFSLNMALSTERGRVHDCAALPGFLESAGLDDLRERVLESSPDVIVASGRVPAAREAGR